MKIFICQVCAHIAFNEAPDHCPVCHAPKDKFKQNDNVFVESKAKSAEAEVKHVPVIKLEKKCGLIPESACIDANIRIGAILHPMEAKHFINWYDCYLDNVFVSRVHLTPNGINPAGALHIKAPAKKLTVVIFCNIHGHWTADAVL